MTSVKLRHMIINIDYNCFHGYSLLIFARSLEKLTTISEVFEGCSEFTTIEILSFCIIIFDNSPYEFRNLLIKAGFSPYNADNIFLPNIEKTGMFYDMTTWTRTRVIDGRLPFFTATKSLKWNT